MEKNNWKVTIVRKMFRLEDTILNYIEDKKSQVEFSVLVLLVYRNELFFRMWGEP